MVSDTNLTLAYRCPKCGCGVLSMAGALSLSGDMFRTKCSCGQSEMTVERLKSGGVCLTVPCMFCPTPHVFRLSADALHTSDGLTLSCPMTGLSIAFAGEKDAVSTAVTESTEEWMNYFRNAGIDPDKLGEEDAAGEQTDDEDAGSPDPDMENLILFTLSELAEEHAIHCGCETGDYEVSATKRGVRIRCKVCGRSREFPADNSLSTESFLDASSLTLTDEENS